MRSSRIGAGRRWGVSGDARVTTTGFKWGGVGVSVFGDDCVGGVEGVGEEFLGRCPGGGTGDRLPSLGRAPVGRLNGSNSNSLFESMRMTCPSDDE